MISERTLAEVHTSIWNELAPNLSKVIRSLNLSGRDRYAKPMVKRVSPDRISLVNEVAFQVFLAAEMGTSITLEEAVSAVPTDLDWGKGSRPDTEVLSEAEIVDVRELAGRTRRGIPQYVRRPQNGLKSVGLSLSAPPDDPIEEKLTIPRFRGVGVLDACEGDAQFGHTLVEIKAGERDIRSIDLRQVIIYYFLGVLGDYEPAIDYCLLLNPRQGYRLHFHFADFMAAISGLSTTEFTAILRDYLVHWKVCD